MEKKKKTSSRLIGVILLIVAVLIIAFAVHLITETNNDKNSGTTTWPAEQEIVEEQLPQYESDDLLNYEFEIFNMPEDAYSILGISQDRLAKDIKTWTYENGFSLAHSATFYTDMTIDFRQNAYTMQCILDDPEQTTITVTYLKTRDLLSFHL